MEGHVLLKKLTRKSIIQQGKNKGLTVGDVLRLRKVDLLYSYFNYDGLTYTDDILDELNIKPEDRIQKPGKNPEKFKYYGNRNVFIGSKIKAIRSIGETDTDKLAGLASVIRKNINKSRAKAKYKGLIQRDKLTFSKSAMMYKNHGH